MDEITVYIIVSAVSCGVGIGIGWRMAIWSMREAIKRGMFDDMIRETVDNVTRGEKP